MTRSTGLGHNWLIYGMISAFLSVITCFERQLVAEINPGCPPSLCNNSVVRVIHVRGDGPNDSLHHVWCFDPKPTILIALTSHETKNISIRWKDFPSAMSSISFSPQPYYSYSVLLNQIYEFNDADDTGVMNVTNNNDTYIRKIPMPDTWGIRDFQQNLGSVVLVMEGSWKNSSLVEKGILRIELETFRKKDHGFKLPHLLHSENTTQMELSLLNMNTKPIFESGRFTVELIMAANESESSSLMPSHFKSLDDEQTPGVFTIVDLQTTASKEIGNGGFLQWRPVAYVAEERDIVNSTETFTYNVTDATISECTGTLLAAFFGPRLKTSLLKAVNISFGAKDDGFYAQSNASIWTVTVGYGHPPDENFSLLVILLMSICLGLPAIVIAFSGLYIAVWKISHRRDDLLVDL